jgi:hypothetical protein
VNLLIMHSWQLMQPLGFRPAQVIITCYSQRRVVGRTSKFVFAPPEENRGTS